MKASYVKKIYDLADYCQAKPCSPLIAQQRIAALALMNLQWWPNHSNPNLTEHPYLIAERLVSQAEATIKALDLVDWAEGDDHSFRAERKANMESMHEALFQDLWTQYDIDKFRSDRVPRYQRRIDLNDLRSLIEGENCVDFGCGHGNFAHAMLSRGASTVLGLDFGEASLRHAEAMRDALGISPEKIKFKKSTVYDSGELDESFGFASQNGVFHHLDDEDRAYREVYRVLKPGGWFWIYTVGANAIIHTLFDGSRLALQNIPNSYITDHLKQMNLSTGMFYQLGDSMIAVYRFETWEGLTARLGKIGFGNFRRCVGGFPGDFGHDVIAADKYGHEKFGEGDLRLVCQKL